MSHIHLFGITFIFFIVGTIFSHAYVRPVWFKCTVMALPFVAPGDRRQFLVLHQALSPVRLGRDGRAARVMGLSLRLHVGRVDVPDVDFARPPAAVTDRKARDLADVG